VIGRWIVFGLVVVGCAFGLMALPPGISTLAFLLISMGGAALALYERRNAPRPIATSPATAVKPSQRLALALPGLPAWFKNAEWGQIWLLVAGLAVSFWASSILYKDPQDIPVSSPFVMLFVGIGMVFVAFNGAVPPVPTIEAPARVGTVQVRWRWLALSLGLFALTSWRGTVKPQEATLFEQLLTWALSIFTLIYAFTPSAKVEDAKPLARYEWITMLVLLAAALVIRGVNLGSEPPILDQDEAMFAQEGAQIMNEHFLATPFEPGAQSWPRLYQGLIGVMVSIFGPTLATARSLAMLTGALTVPALYLLGREMGGWRFGLVAALFMLTWTYHVQFSRLALNQPVDGLFTVLSYYFLLRGLRRAAPTDFALSGVMLAFSQLFYLGARIVPAVMAGLVIWLFLRQREVVTKNWRLLVIVPVVAFLVLVPHHYFLLYFNQPLTTRADKNIFVSGQWDEVVKTDQLDEYIIHQLKYSFLSTIWLHDAGGWHGQGSSILGLFGGVAFLIGVLVCTLILWRRPVWALLCGWVLAVIFIGSTLSISPPQYQRYINATAAFCLLIALAVEAIGHRISQLTKVERFRAYVALGLGIALSLGNLWYYLYVHIPEGRYLNNRPNWATNATAREMVAAADAGRQVVLFYDFATGVENTLVVQYFMTGRKYIVDEQGLDSIDPLKPFTFVFGVARKPDLERMKIRYPGGRERKVYLVEDGTLGMYIYERP